MGADQLFSGVAAATALVAAIAAIISKRRQPKLDDANVDLIKSTVKDSADKYHARRDLELIRWQAWIFDKVRPWGRDVQVKFDLQGEQVQELAALLGRTVDRLHIDPFPEIPPPIPETA